MGKEKHLNPVLFSSRKRSEPTQQRKTRSDKLHDIKIPISESIDTVLRRESRRHWNGSKTAIGTETLIFGLEQIFIYPEVPYSDQPLIVHCKVNHETYQKIGDLAAEWRCSIRKAAYRIFMEAYKKRNLGGVTNGDL